MGVDIAVYRARVGAWAARACPGRAVSTLATFSSLWCCSCGGVALLCAAVLATLLIIGGVELNPGPSVQAAVTTCSKCDRSERRIRRLEADLAQAHAHIGELSLKIKEFEELMKGKEEQNVPREEKKRNEPKNANRTPQSDTPYGRKVKVIGDSMLRHSGGVLKKKGADVSFFPGVNMQQMTSVVNKAEPNEDIEVVLVHVGTNVRKRQPVYDTINQCVELGHVIKAKFKNARVIISGIMRRNDVHIGKTRDLNRGLLWACAKFDGLFVDPNHWLGAEDLGRDGLHLNFRGAWKLGCLHDQVIHSYLRGK